MTPMKISPKRTETVNQQGRKFGLRLSAVAALVIGAFALATLTSPPAGALSDADKDEIRTLVRDYLVENPEILAEMIEALETSREAKARAETEKGILEHRDALFDGNPAFVAGNPKGTVTLVEFFDYRCGYCKRAVPDLLKLIAENPDLKVVFKDYPVLGPDSLFASRAAIAASLQNRYSDFHFALMANDGPVTEEAIFSVADNIGLDVRKMRDDMDSEDVDRILEENFALAQALNINGTPNFIIGDQMLPGAVGFKAMSETIAKVRDSDCAVC